MKKLTTEHEFRQISTRDINIDPLYQRDLDKGRVSKITREFNPGLVNPCKVSFRDGKFYVFDGQHTIAVLKSLHNGQDCMVDCKVYYGLTRLDEAMLFVEQNGVSRAVHATAKYRALYGMGDPDVTDMVKTCESLGLIIDFSNSAGRNRIVALAALFQLYSRMPKADLCAVLKILKDAWNGETGSFSRELLQGMARFYEVYKGRFSAKTLTERLRRTSPMAIIREGRMSRSPGATKYARQILGAYNYNASKNKLPDEL